MSVSYEYYKIFYYVASYQNFSKAAKVLLNSQPNVTRVINNLEQELGCKLFERSTKGVFLTEAGEKLFLHVQTAHKHIQKAEAELRQLTAKEREQVTVGFSIGITEMLFHNNILPVLHDYHVRHPEVKIQIVNESTPKLLTELSDGLVDLAIVTSYRNDNKQYHSVLLKSFQDILIAGPSYGYLRGKKIRLQELMGLPIINLWSGTETYAFYRDYFASAGFVFEPEVETATTDQVLSFVENDMGVGFVSPEYSKEYLKQEKVYQIDLEEEIPTRYISLVKNSGMLLNEEAEELAEMIVHSAQKLQKK